MRCVPSCILLLAAIAVVRCSLDKLAGGGSDLPDKVVMGKIFSTDELPAANTQVTIIPARYNSISDGPIPAALIDTTDSSGAFRINRCPAGDYNIQAVHLYRRTRLLIAGVTVGGDTARVPADTLRLPGVVKVYLPDDIDPANYQVYFPGTTIAARPAGTAGYVIIDSVPAGKIPSVYYVKKNNPVPAAVRYNLLVPSGDTAVVAKPGWNYARRLHLNTTATGAQVAGSVVNFPVLVRLTGGNFDFSQAQAGGEDLRFTKADTTALPYEIERWDAGAQQAEVWVKVDTVYGNDSAHSFMMYWGDSAATTSSNGAAVFDTAAGFAGVWHLGESGGAVASDATVNGINGIATATTPVAGIVGTAQMFNGTSSFIEASGPASDRLNFQDNDPYSLCAWVNASVIDTFHAILFKSNFQYGLQIRPEKSWEFFNYASGTGWQWTQAPASAGSWHLVTGVWNGNQQYLYVDGMAVDSAKGVTAWSASRVFTSPFQIGNCPDGAADVDRHFNGAIDEVRVEKTARNADWIKLCYMNQKEQDALVKW